MKKNIIFFAILSFFLSYALCASASFDSNLYYGLKKNDDVKKLQQFLFDKKFLSVAPTGNFLSLTLAAVKKYQSSAGIITTGLVGPLTRTAINKELAVNLESITPPTTIPYSITPATASLPSVTFTAPESDITLVRGTTYTLTWTSQNIPASSTANFRLYLGSGESNASYEMKTIATNVPIASGKLLWKIPDDGTILESQYHIGLSYNIGNLYYSAKSNPFNIRKLNPEISITAPVTATGFVKGRTYDITWTSQDMPASATATFYYSLPGDMHPSNLIADNVLVSAGKLSWTIPDISLGQYKISLITSNGLSANSGNFNVQSPSPQMAFTYPAAGNILTVGKTYTVTWTYQDVDPKTPIVILLYSYFITNPFSKVITAVINNPPISEGKALLTIPLQTLSADYVLTARSTDGKVSATSGVFYIRPPDPF